jgi:Family of unknown function (DUF6502)
MRSPRNDVRSDGALTGAIVRLLRPLARLAIARGLTFPVIKELLKQEFVHAAREAQPDGGLTNVSRIATAAGLTRREVTRLALEQPPALADRPSPATQVFTRWQALRSLRNRSGKPKVLPRQGPAPSFEALALAITRDVHPRSLLDELCRLDLARLDEAADTVALQGDAFVPSGDRVRMLGFLADNVGDHLRAAVANVLATGRPPHLEQALFAEGLSAESLEALRPLLRAQWATLRQALVPALEARIEADARSAGPRARVRLGLYAYNEVPGATQVPGDPHAEPRPVRARRASARRIGPARKDPLE